MRNKCWGFWSWEEGLLGECRGVPVHKWNPTEVWSDGDVWQRLPARPGHFDHNARDRVFSVVC